MERFVQSVVAQTRTLKNDMEKRYGMKMTGNSKIAAWLIRHAAWLVTSESTWRAEEIVTGHAVERCHRHHRHPVGPAP